jgi:hypothetical protein
VKKLARELGALAFTLCGSYYVILTLGGATKSAAIWATIIATCVHLIVAMTEKEDV